MLVQYIQYRQRWKPVVHTHARTRAHAHCLFHTKTLLSVIMCVYSCEIYQCLDPLLWTCPRKTCHLWVCSHQQTHSKVLITANNGERYKRKILKATSKGGRFTGSWAAVWIEAEWNSNTTEASSAFYPKSDLLWNSQFQMTVKCQKPV